MMGENWLVSGPVAPLFAIQGWNCQWVDQKSLSQHISAFHDKLRLSGVFVYKNLIQAGEIAQIRQNPQNCSKTLETRSSLWKTFGFLWKTY